MSNRFQYKEKHHTYRKLILSLLVFILVIGLFYFGINSLSGDTTQRQKESLESSIKNTVAYCYAVEGAYPESIDYMKDNYGLTYDENKFYIGYRISGANILPDITVIEVGD